MFSVLCSALCLLLSSFGSTPAQQAHADPNALLQYGLRRADLYNWADAAPAFAQAEELFARAGDRRNTLYAKLGRIRANVEREQRTLPETSAHLGAELRSNPLLRKDLRLRLFCLIIKGDIDTEVDTGVMRRDWEQVQALATELGDSKWQYRALAQLGLAAFYEGDISTARKNVGSALLAATNAGDVGAQVRFLTALGEGLVKSKMYEQAIPYFEKARKIASTTPEAGYQYSTQEGLAGALVGLGRLSEAERLTNEILDQAQKAHRAVQEATALVILAGVAKAQRDSQTATAALKRAVGLAQSSGLVRTLAEAQSLLARIYQTEGDLGKAERYAELAAGSTQASGDDWAVPERLQTAAELQIERGQYAGAERIFERAAAFVDTMIGNVSSVLEKTALVRAASELYTRHFALVAEQFRDPVKAYAIVEQVRGRVATDLLRSGSKATEGAIDSERRLSELRLRLMVARSTEQVRRMRDDIFMEEQSRWVTPGVSILRSFSHSVIPLKEIERRLHPSEVILEYVVAVPHSYCLAISPSGCRLVRLAGKNRIEELVNSYLKAVAAKLPAYREGRNLYEALLQPIGETTAAKRLIVIRDGPLHRVPFDAVIDPAGHYVLERHTVLYAPSASSYYLLAKEAHELSARGSAVLAVGGVPYRPLDRKSLGVKADEVGWGLGGLPFSAEEARLVAEALPSRRNRVLLGNGATETAFKRADLSHFNVIHMAVHGFTDFVFPDRASLVLASDVTAREDGLLQASEIVQMKLNADLVVLSSCDTGFGPLQGEEGVATLSRAFLLAGAHGVVSALWPVDDIFSLFLMKRFYRHLAMKQPAPRALQQAKHDAVNRFGKKAVPYYWAGFTYEGAPSRGLVPATTAALRNDDPKHSQSSTDSQTN